MSHQAVIPSPLDQRGTGPVGVSLKNNTGIVLIFTQHAKIKGDIAVRAVQFQNLIDLLQTPYCSKGARVIRQFFCLLQDIG